MKDGYYWAKAFEDDEWHIVEVWTSDGQYTYEIGIELPFPLGDYEFGDKIEIPEKYT